ncbi:MAG: molybdopterin dinucleotide-binding protein [archaeon]|nr:molybdopterin dinucleotide-binding protein [archaeon]
MTKIEVRLTSGGSIGQGVVTKGGGKALSAYTRNAGIIFLDSEDLKKLGVYPLTPVRIKSEMNEVIVYAQESSDGPHPGVAFMPRGPWCNLLVRPKTYSSGCAMFKDTDITVEPAPTGVKPLDMPQLMRKYYIETKS